MDLILNFMDYYAFTPYVYPKTWAEDNPWRQFISLSIILTTSAYSMYFILGILSYRYLFDHRLMKHHLFLKNQVKIEITHAMAVIPLTSIPTAPFFLLYVRGYSKLYDDLTDSGMSYTGEVLNITSFILFTDSTIYWIHRFLHHKLVYKHLHKRHHIYKISTPWSSHSLHPVDALIQGMPYYIYPFLFPLHKVTFLGLFVFVNIWAVCIHDSDYRVPDFLKSVINSSAHHTDHHLFYKYSYGQYFTIWDIIGGTYRSPSSFEGNGPFGDFLAKSEVSTHQQNGVSKTGSGSGLENGRAKKDN